MTISTTELQSNLEEIRKVNATLEKIKLCNDMRDLFSEYYDYEYGIDGKGTDQNKEKASTWKQSIVAFGRKHRKVFKVKKKDCTPDKKGLEFLHYCYEVAWGDYVDDLMLTKDERFSLERDGMFEHRWIGNSIAYSILNSLKKSTGNAIPAILLFKMLTRNCCIDCLINRTVCPKDDPKDSNPH